MAVPMRGRLMEYHDHTLMIIVLRAGLSLTIRIGIKLISRAVKMWKRVVEARLRREVISEEKYGVVSGRGATDAIFALRMLIERYRVGQKELHCACRLRDRVRREETWYCMKKSGVPEKYVMERLADESRSRSPWTMIFADYFVLCGKNREEDEEELERCTGEKGNQSKQEEDGVFVCNCERRRGKVVKKVVIVTEFRYLWSTVQRNGECGREVKTKVQV
ncbi:uncharacterized protein [Penaeus vannamei]|uniref:uncharacterized protein n=1 Tax=Penaeus vannamei TaxID=6689 RepID=UPI00387F66B1